MRKTGGTREAKKPKTRPRGEWCPDESVLDDLAGEEFRGSPPKRRCPTCGRRVTPRRIENGDVIYRIPPHKTSSVK